MAQLQLDDWLFAPYCQFANTLELHRRILVISGDVVFCNRQLETLLSSAPTSVTINQLDCTQLKGKRRQHFLGTECDIAIIDCHKRFAPGDIMAIAGTIRRSGSLVLVCPALSTWPSNLDTSFISHGFTLSFSHYLDRFINKLTNTPTTALLTTDVCRIPDLPVVTGSRTKHTLKGQPSAAHSLFASADQEKAFELLQQTYQKGPLHAVVTAPRGRGKSSLLGLFILELLKRGNDVLLTSSLIANTEQVFTIIKKVSSSKENRKSLSADMQIDASNSTPTKIAFAYGAKKAIVRWVAPDSDFFNNHKQTNHQYVIVDEAASFPIPVILNIVRQFPNWVLSTTLQGYEGSGKGFMHKLVPLLTTEITHKNPFTEQEANRLKECDSDASEITEHALSVFQLKTPLRWAEDDPIETFFESTCLFEQQDNLRRHNKITLRHDWNVKCEFTLSKFSEINESDLQEVMYLLSLAHYQTTPDDLMRIMDSPDIILAMIVVQRRVIAAAIINIEGSTPLIELSEDIACGKRRPKGHLGAQRLALLSADPEIAKYKYWRINRIAVLPELQSKGIGSYVLQNVLKAAAEKQIDGVLTSYGQTPELNKFWQKNGFLIVDEGKKRNKASGETSALAVKTDSNCVKYVVKRLIRNKHLEQSSTSFSDLPLDTREGYRKKLMHFSLGHRSLDDVWPIINKIAVAIEEKQSLCGTSGLETKPSDQCTKTSEVNPLLVSTCLIELKKPIINVERMAQLFGISGIKGVTQVMRKWILEALEYC